MTKRKLVIISAILSAIVLALFIVLIVLISGGQNEEIKSDKYDVVSIIKNLNEKNTATTAKNILIIAESESLNQGKNSYMSVKSAIKNGYNGICVDVAFRKDGTPVLAKNFNDVGKDSTELEKVFKLIESTDFKLVLNMGEVSDMAEIKDLIDKYELKNNIIILADEEVKLVAIKRHLSNYKVCLKIETDGVDFKNREEVRQKVLSTRQSGALYIAVKPEFITKEFTDACIAGRIGVLAYDADTNSGIQTALSSEIEGVITVYPEDVKSIIDSLN